MRGCSVWLAGVCVFNVNNQGDVRAFKEHFLKTLRSQVVTLGHDHPFLWGPVGQVRNLSVTLESCWLCLLLRRLGGPSKTRGLKSARSQRRAWPALA